MFNNPFDSFHNTIAEAKEEREQLDRLLTISTTRERLIVAAVAVLLIVLAAWLYLGSVTRSLAVDGIVVASGEALVAGKRSVEAIIWVEKDTAPSIEAGMPTMLEVANQGGDPDRLDGTVATISAVAPTTALAVLESTPPVSAHRINILLDEAFDTVSLADKNCRVVIELGTQSPIALLRMRRL